MGFTVGGQALSLTPEQVRRKLRGVAPEKIRQHAVEVNGIAYPVKQALDEVTALDRADFTSHEARRVFRKLGFHVSRSQ